MGHIVESKGNTDSTQLWVIAALPINECVTWCKVKRYQSMNLGTSGHWTSTWMVGFSSQDVISY